MFGPEAPPLEWDSRGDYSRQNIEVYYLSHAATPLTLDQLTEVRASGWVGAAGPAAWEVGGLACMGVWGGASPGTGARERREGRARDCLACRGMPSLSGQAV